MMFGWGAGAKRFERLEQELTALRASLADANARAAIEAERAGATTAMAALGERLLELRDIALAQSARFVALEAAADRHDARLAALEARPSAPDADVEAARREDDAAWRTRQESESGSLRSSLLVLERRVQLDAEEAARTGRALYERIARLAGADPAAP